MKTVLYNHALQPIAVIPLTDYEVGRLRAASCITRPVPHETDPAKFRVVPIIGERLCRGQHETFVLFAADEADDAPLHQCYGRG